MMDIDEFKKVNDTLGHLVGDTVIKEVARITKDTLRMTDYCGRYGGDEFILILTQTKKEGAMTYAERIRRRIEKTRHREWGDDFHISVSIGVTEYFRQEDPARTITRADEALYLAKNSGRNRIEFLMSQPKEKD
jgi:diguanylate cyclase (GGDEF)-like protein